jgi:gag-polypeptide of LTR copia-type/Zinc knuckle
MENDYSVEKIRIQKLSGPNYRSWMIQLQRLLIGKSLWNVVKYGVSAPGAAIAPEAESSGRGKSPEGSGTTEAQTSPGSAEGRTDVNDAKASTLIMGLCTSNALQHVLLLSTAKEQWDTLKKLYAPLGLQQLSAKIQAFTSYKAPDGAKIAEVVTQLDTLQFEIGSIEPAERPSDTLKISILLRALRTLDERYDPLVLQLEITDSVKDYDKLVMHLTEFERRMAKDPLKENALTASDKKKQKGGFKGKCFTCGKVGHRSKECRSGEKKASTGPLATPGGRKGLSPPPEDPKPPKAKTEPKDRVDSAIEACWLATEPADELLWVVDSGCSRHMTYCKEAFIEYALLDTPIEIGTASGSRIEAIAEGAVTLKVAVRATVRTVTLTGVLHVPRLAGSLVSVIQLQNRGII